MIAVTRSGLVRGLSRANGTSAFLGIPYAEPPCGNLRFTAPVAKGEWDGVYDASRYGPTPQRRALAEVTTIPEPSIPGDSILNLNVFAPGPAAGTGPHPVLVWIHGGGYVAGSPASPWYDGRSFARDGVVTVTISYRLGFDGFGWLPDAPSNRGVLDWLLALEWVRDNIAAFGGDPANITLAGQSAGGGAVMTLLTLPRAQGLFHKAASMSGVPADIPLDSAKRYTGAVAERLGVEPTSEGLGSVPEDELITAQQWRTEPPATRDPLAWLKSLGKAGALGLGPIIDHDIIENSVEAGLAQGQGADKPLLVGATREEFSRLLVAHTELFTRFSPAEALRIMGVDEDQSSAYAESAGTEPTASVVGRFVSDRVFRRRVPEWTALRGTLPTWVYDFTWASAVSGVSEHCLDVPFLFDVLDDPDVQRVAGAAPPQELADAVHGAFVRLARTGDPGWKQALGGTDDVKAFDVRPGRSDTYEGARIAGPVQASSAG